MLFRIWNSQFNLSLCLSIAVLSLAKGAMLSGATCAVLCSRDCKRLGVPALAEHRVPRPETREHSLGFTRTHHPDRLRPVQREHRTQWNDINILWNTRGKWRTLLLVYGGCFQTTQLHLQSMCELVLMFLLLSCSIWHLRCYTSSRMTGRWTGGVWVQCCMKCYMAW